MEFRVKKQYKPKEQNEQKLKVFLKKIENGTGNISQKQLGNRK